MILLRKGLTYLGHGWIFIAWFLIYPFSTYAWQWTEANDSRENELLLAISDDSLHHSFLPTLSNFNHLLLDIHYIQSSLLNVQGNPSNIIYSTHKQQAIWLQPIDGMKFAMESFQRYEKFNYRDSALLNFQESENRIGYGFSWWQHLGEQNKLGFDFIIDLPDLQRFEPTLALRMQNKLWSLEYGLAFQQADDILKVQSLDSTTKKENVAGVYRASHKAQYVKGNIPLGRGSLYGMVEWNANKPEHADKEYLLTDSSQSLRLGIGNLYATQHGSWHSWLAYGETESISMGLRIPPGSEGAKRFHYARLLSSRLEGRIGRCQNFSNWSGEINLNGFDYALKSKPAMDALDNRLETLNFNRLGLSFLSDVFGGLYRQGELMTLDLQVRRLSLSFAAQKSIKNFTLRLDAPISATLFHSNLQQQEVAKKIFLLDSGKVKTFLREGNIMATAPKLHILWTLKSFVLALSCSQALPFYVDIYDPRITSSPTPSITVSNKKKLLEIFHNGFEFTGSFTYAW